MDEGDVEGNIFHYLTHFLALLAKHDLRSSIYCTKIYWRFSDYYLFNYIFVTDPHRPFSGKMVWKY